MRLKLEHITTFSYDEPVYETATEIRLRPCAEKTAAQRVLDFNIKLSPDAPLFRYTDYFGNGVNNFNILQPHTGLTITSTATVETGAGRTASAPIDDLRALGFLHESRFVHLDDAARTFARDSERLTNPLAFAESLSNKINREFAYEPGTTDVHSPSSDVITLRTGVCQDFAHVMIAACRVEGIPARYVSGYLYGGALSERDDRASHAWCEIYAGQADGWVGFDPTHDTTYVDERYIKIGVGRDYSDVPPVRGTYKGNASEKLNVVVHVTEV